MLRWLLLLLPLVGHAAITGVVETTAEERLEGEVRIEAGKFLVVATNGVATNISLAAVKSFSAAPSATPTNNLTILSEPPERGLLGIYFNSPDCSGDFVKTRYDPVIDFDWGMSAPMPEMNSNGFSVRWIGSLIVSNTEHYTFHTVTDDGVRLWINNRLIIDAWKDEVLNLAAPPLILIGGQTNELRMEMYDARDRAVARLFWSSPTTPRGIIPRQRLFPARNVDLPSVPAVRPKYPAGALLVDGSFLPGIIESVDRSSVNISGLPSLSSIHAARLIFKPMTSQMETNLQRGRFGVLLRTGDFVEGDFRGFTQGDVEVNSVVLGAKKISGAQVVAVLLREPQTTPARFEVVTREGGLYRANSVRLVDNALVVRSAVLADRQVEWNSVLELRTAEKPSKSR